MRFKSIKTRLIILVLISSLPGLIVIAALGLRNRDHVRDQARSELTRIAQLLGRDNETYLEGTRQLLMSLAHSSEIRSLSSPAIARLLKDIQGHNLLYDNIFVADARGKVLASSNPLPFCDIKDRKYFRDAVRSKKFSAGEFVQGKITGKPLMHFSYPIFAKTGQFLGIVGVAIELGSYGKVLSIAKMPAGSNIALTDHRGIRLYRYPDDQKYAGSPDLPSMMGHMQDPVNGGVFSETGVDGVKRMYSYKVFALSGDKRPFLYMRIGTPSALLDVKSRKEFLMGIALLTITFLVSLLIAWSLGKIGIGKKLDIIRRTTRRFGTGDFSKRIDLPENGDELDELGRVLNDASEKIQSRDIENRLIHEALKNSEDTLRSIFNSVHDAIFIHREDGVIIDVNDRVLEMYGVTREGAIGSSVAKDYSPPSISEKWLTDIWKKVLFGHTENFEWLAQRPGDGSVFDVDVFLTRVMMNGQGCILATARDISSRKQMEKAFEGQRLLMESVINALPAPLFYKDRQGRYLWCNRSFETAFGYSRNEIFEKTVHDIFPRDLAQIHERADNALFETGQLPAYEVRFPYADGIKRDAVMHKAPFKGNDGTINGLVGVVIDVSDLKRTEDELRQSLKEKEVLLKEIHHRVKNNLQIISSLLNLQSAYIKDTEMIDIFKDSQARVKTMALVHQKLYQSGNLADVDFGEYADELVRDLFRAYGATAENIGFEVVSQNIFLDIDTIIPLGLIISELVSNSLKHAYPEGAKGTISVGFAQKSNGKTILTVKDDGTGFPDTINFTDAGSLGLQLVMTLVEQLDGEMQLYRKPGTTVVITLRGNNYEQ